MIACCPTKAKQIEYIPEEFSEDGEIAFRDPTYAQVVSREWDVADPTAREQAAEDELGQHDPWYDQHATWFIDEEKNAAALVVFRTRTPGALKDWQRQLAA